MHKSLLTLVLSITIMFNVSGQFTIELEPFAENLNQPLDITTNGSGQLFVIEKPGLIQIVQADGTVGQEPFLDITDRVDNSRGEEGLLGLAFSPNFDTNGEFYVNYTDARGLTIISRFSTMAGDPNTGDPSSETVLLQFAQPFSNHNGGDLEFGPDGYLYAATGDGGSAGDPMNNSQTGSNYLGKILRLDVDGEATYAIPPDNPFVGDPTVLDEIWALGLRNPWRMSFDRMTGDFWIGDVGQGEWEEVDFQPASSPGGENYGWRCYEGNEEYDTDGCGPPENYQFPIYVYSNNRVGNGCSITGGYVYRGNDFEAMQGWYLYADYCSGKFWALRAADTTNIPIGDFGGNQFVGFGEDDNGELYVAAIQEGRIYRIVIPCDLSISASSTDETCPGSADGTASVTVSDTTANVDILWSNGDTTAEVTGLAPGTYTVRVISDGCDLLETVMVDSSDLQTSCLLDTLFPGPYCQGDTVSLRACNAPAGYTYEWSLMDAVIAETNTPELRVTESGTYSVAFKGDCPLGASQEVEILFAPTPEQSEITRSMDTLWADASADSYRWYRNDTLIAETNVPYILIMGEGDYTVQGVNGDCEGPLSEIYTVINTSSADLNDGWMKIYPNPSNGRYTLTFEQEQDGRYQVMTADGRKILEGNLKQVVKLNLEGHPKGIYLLQISRKGSDDVLHQLILTDR